MARSRETKNRPNDLISINTGYGQLTAPKRLIDLWIRYGWPRGPIMRSMTETGSIDGVRFDDRGQVAEINKEAAAGPDRS